MWTKNLGKNKRLAAVGVALGIFTALALNSPAFTQTPEKSPAPVPAVSPSTEIIFLGKFFCSLKRPVILPFPAQVTALPAKTGQLVREGEELATFTLLPEATAQIRRRVTTPQLKDLEVRLADLDRRQLELNTRLRSTRQLEKQNLASPQTLRLEENELALLQKQKKALRDSLEAERQVARDDQAVLREQLGEAVTSGKIPSRITLKAPITGHLIWINPELRVGAHLSPGPVFQVGDLDPMILRAQVHEIEVMQLAPGDRAEVTVESLPGRKFPADLSRLPWAPLTTALEQPSYYDVEFKVPNPDLLLKEGLKARVTLRKSP